MYTSLAASFRPFKWHGCCCTPTTFRRLGRLLRQGEAVASAFWVNFRNQGLGGDFAYVILVAERLLGVDRPGAALDLIALYSRPEGEKLDSERAEVVVRGLEAILQHGDAASEVRALSQYELMRLFTALEGSDLPRERVAALEWAYLPAFGIDA